MAATSSGDSYYCHVCETEVVPNLQVISKCMSFRFH
uniref:Hypotheticial protein n=1 Tax=Schistosoma japonicum TaxID=6182 RepID=C7TZD3_SCHJA|nr:hypotheticial protein [Schistosoma japonicum]